MLDDVEFPLETEFVIGEVAEASQSSVEIPEKKYSNMFGLFFVSSIKITVFSPVSRFLVFLKACVGCI